jgi:putative inorganic carbon (hco3(-)) transporter
LLVPYSDFIFLFAFGFWLLALLRCETTFRVDRVYIFIGLYAFTLAVSTVFSVDPQKSFYKLLGEFYLFALAVLAFNLGREEGFFRQIVLAWLAGTALTIVASIFGVALFAGGLQTPETNYFLSPPGSLPAGYPRIRALFNNANMMCNFLNVSLMITLLAHRLGWLKRYVAALFYVGLAFAAIFTLSPGLGGLGLSLALWFAALIGRGESRVRRQLILAAGTLFAIAVFSSTLVSPDTANTDQDLRVPVLNRTIEPSVRVLVWQKTLANFAHNPWLGKGTGTDVAGLIYDTQSGERQLLVDGHNMWLNILGQMGVFGLTLFMCLLAYLIYRCSLTSVSGDETGLILIGLSCAFIGAFLYQGLAGSFEDARHLWVLVGLLVASRYLVPAGASAGRNDILQESTGP